MAEMSTMFSIEILTNLKSLMELHLSDMQLIEFLMSHKTPSC